MKHLKRFKINEGTDLKPNSTWDDYVKGLFHKYMTLFNSNNGDIIDYEDDIIIFFDELQEEIDNSVEIDIWVFETKYYFVGLAKAYGPKHAMVKLAIEEEDIDLIFELEDCLWVPDDGDIDDKISKLENEIESIKGEIEKWKKIY